MAPLHPPQPDPSQPGPSKVAPSLSQRLGDKVPDFRLPNLAGTPVRLQDKLGEARGVVIVFWSGLCSHCQRYDSWLGGFPTRYPLLGLLVVASRQNEDATSIARIADQRDLSFPILIDGDRSVARSFYVQQTPRSFLVDGQGKLLYRGAIDNFKYPRDPDYEPLLEAAIEDFFAGKPIRRPETPSFGCPIESTYYQA
ncbi:MAG: redoxin domain-containing protein [Deltaproteobacteria bacterium]|nr:redoxin domain-containing protein [Deltaproteobacteria bacterium]